MVLQNLIARFLIGNKGNLLIEKWKVQHPDPSSIHAKGLKNTTQTELAATTDNTIAHPQHLSDREALLAKYSSRPLGAKFQKLITEEPKGQWAKEVSTTGSWWHR